MSTRACAFGNDTLEPLPLGCIRDVVIFRNVPLDNVPLTYPLFDRCVDGWIFQILAGHYTFIDAFRVRTGCRTKTKQ